MYKPSHKLLRRLNRRVERWLDHGEAAHGGQEAQIDGFRIRLPLEILSVDMIRRPRSGRFEEEDERLFAKHLVPGDFVLQLGGGVGLMSMRLARRVGPTGRVLMAEPDPRIHALAIENLALNSCGNVETRQAAAVASRQSRTITFHRHPNFWNSGLNRPGASSSPVEVPAVYPPDLVPRDWPGRKVLQCDIEGYEAELLAIAEVVAPFECIIVECHFGNTPETGASPFVAMWRSLVDCGFALADIDTFTFVFSKNAAALDTQASAEKAQTHEP